MAKTKKRLFTDEQKLRHAATMFKHRLGLECTVDEAIPLYLEAKANRPQPNLWARIARENGISPHLFRERIRRKWTQERAATEPPNPRFQHGERRYYKNDDDKKLNERAIAYISRMKIPMTRDEAIEVIKAKDAAKAEREYWQSIAAQNGISKILFDDRRNMRGATMQQAALTPKHHRLDGSYEK